MTKTPIHPNSPIGPGTVLGSDDLPYQSLIPGNPHLAKPAGSETSDQSPSEFVRNDEARRFGRQVAEVNPPLDRSKIFRS